MLFLKVSAVSVMGAAAMWSGAHFVSPIASALLPDDKSIYMMPNKKDWPGDQLSERQFEWAVHYFADPKICDHPWRWALIGPGDYLLKGTHYQVRDAYDAPVANVTGIKGYWGDGFDTFILSRSVTEMKVLAEEDATKDCEFGIKP